MGEYLIGEVIGVFICRPITITKVAKRSKTGLRKEKALHRPEPDATLSLLKRQEFGPSFQPS